MFNTKTNKMKTIILIYYASSIIISMILFSGAAFKSFGHFTLAIILSILIGWLLVPLRIIIEIVRMVKIILKMAHLLPVYPIDLLIRVKRSYLWANGLCSAINLSAQFFNLHSAKSCIQHIEKYDRNIAIQNFNGGYDSYWWEEGIWNTGRLDFLNFLIEENKNNKIDLRKVY